MLNMNNTVTNYDEPESELLTEDLDILKECDIEEIENVSPLDSSYDENAIAFFYWICGAMKYCKKQL